MYSRIKILGHPIHPMLVGFPVTLYTAALLSYILASATADALWLRFAIAANVAGVVMALITAIPGFLDWLTAIPPASAAKRTGLKHMALNVTALVVFAVNAWLHAGYWRATVVPLLSVAIGLAVIGILITIGAGWLGWSLVQRHHVGVELTPEQERIEPSQLSRAA